MEDMPELIQTAYVQERGQQIDQSQKEAGQTKQKITVAKAEDQEATKVRSSSSRN